MAQHRSRRLAEELKKELTDIVQNNIRDPRKGFISFTDVDVTKDLRYAKIFYSVLGDEEVRKESALVLEKAKGYIRSELSQRLNLRYTPELTFKYDESLTYGAKIDKILNNITDGDQKNDF